MPLHEARSAMPVSREELFAWHSRPGAFDRLAPPWETLRVIERGGGIEAGGFLHMALKKGPLWLRWDAEHTDYDPPGRFVDRQVRGPFAEWVHEHLCLESGGGRSELHDRVTYRLPGGALGQALGGAKASRDLRRLFAFRHARTRRDLERHAAFADRGSLRIAVTGASGLVGSALTAFLRGGGHEVVRLVRREPREGEVRWDPSSGVADRAGLEGLDAVVHLAGENIASGRWNAARKESIRRSRVEGTRVLSECLASLNSPPGVLVSASAIGYYGNRGDETVDEASAPGEGFLADVCREWEAAAEAARHAGIRVVHLRIGVVMAAKGGALPRMLTPFRLGLGGRLGSGRQVMSWIGLDDLVGVFQRAIMDEGLSGPANAVAPGALTNAEFTKVLAKVLRRPALFPAPAQAIRLAAGEMGEALLLGGARVVPRALQGAGHAFLTPDLESALRWEMGLPQG